MVKHTQTFRRLLSTNCLSIFDHFVGLALKRFTYLLLFSRELEDVLLSHVDAFVNFLNPSLLTSLIKLRRNHPTWSLKKVVDYLKVPGITVPEPVKDEVDAPVAVRYTKQDVSALLLVRFYFLILFSSLRGTDFSILVLHFYNESFT